MFSKRSIVIVTGATGPIGSSFAQTFAAELKEGSILIVSSRSRQRVGELKDVLQAINPEINVGIVEWDMDKPDLDIFRDDIQQLINSKINYAGTPIKLKSASFENAILVHNAAVLGDMHDKMADYGHHLDKVQHALNVNLLSVLALNTAFLEVFKNAPHKVIVNMSAPSANSASPSFGYTAMCKSARQMAMNILAKEETTVKVLHFEPQFVDTEALREILEHSHNEQIKEFVRKLYAHQTVNGNKLLTGQQVAAALVHTLEGDKFSSADVVKAVDACHL